MKKSYFITLYAYLSCQNGKPLNNFILRGFQNTYDLLSSRLRRRQIDSGEPTIALKDFMSGENRFKTLMKNNPERAERLLKIAEEEYAYRRKLYKELAALPGTSEEAKK